MGKKPVLLVFILFFSLTIFLQPYSALAISQEQREAIRSGIYYFDIEDTLRQQSNICDLGVNASFSGSENAEVAFNFFREQGLSANIAAGILGNLEKESNIMPNRAETNVTPYRVMTIDSVNEITPGRGFGIAQWTTAGRQQNWLSFADDLGLDPLSLELQLLFLMHELETEPFWGYQQLLDTNTLIEATWIFLSFFERPAKVNNAGFAATTQIPPEGNPAREELNERLAYAAAFLDIYGGNDVIEGGCGIGSTAEPNFAAIPSIGYDGSPPGAHRASNCSGGFTPGASSLRDFVIDTWTPPVTNVWGYSCRAMVCGTGSCRTSIHGLGRAIDIMVDGTTPEGLRTGNEIRNFLYNNAERLGIQAIIWNRGIWTAPQNGWRDYTGPHPHIDHLHVEVNIQASSNPDLAEGLFLSR